MGILDFTPSFKIRPQWPDIMNQKILVADDEPDVLNLVASNLSLAGFDVIKAEDGPSALSMAKEDSPRLLILDLMLPELSGLDVCRMLKADPRTASIPVVMLTAKSEEVDRIVGLELGADDYITKPFSPRELLLRIRNVLKRVSAPVEESNYLAVGEIVLDRARLQVTVCGSPIDFTATELNLLKVLIERRGLVQSRNTLLNDVWGYESVIDTRTVDTHIRRLREKLGPAADCIQTVRGFGYKIKE